MKKIDFTYAVGAAGAGISALTLAPQWAMAEEGLGINLIIPKMGEFIPMLIVFLVVWFILAKFAWPVIIGKLDERAATIKDSLESAEATKVEAQQLLDEYKAQLAEARRQSSAILEEARRSGEDIKNDITAKAQEEANEIVAKARLAIESEKKQAMAELQSSVADLSVAVAAKYIGQELSDDDHRKLIEKYLAEAGKLDA